MGASVQANHASDPLVDAAVNLAGTLGRRGAATQESLAKRKDLPGMSVNLDHLHSTQPVQVSSAARGVA